MNQIFRYIVFAFAVFLAPLILYSCGGGTVDPGADQAGQLIAEGWQSYTSGNYLTARDKFEGALQLDLTRSDAYNGSGWSNAKLNALLNASNRFSAALSRDPSNLDLRAGIAVVYNAQKNYSGSVTNILDVLQSNPNWVFSRDTSVSARDLRHLLAEDYFALANFSSALSQVKILNPAFGADVSTVEGRSALASEIERLRLLV